MFGNVTFGKKKKKEAELVNFILTERAKKDRDKNMWDETQITSLSCLVS